MRCNLIKREMNKFLKKLGNCIEILDIIIYIILGLIMIDICVYLVTGYSVLYCVLESIGGIKFGVLEMSSIDTPVPSVGGLKEGSEAQSS